MNGAIPVNMVKAVTGLGGLKKENMVLKETPEWCQAREIRVKEGYHKNTFYTHMKFSHNELSILKGYS